MDLQQLFETQKEFDARFSSYDQHERIQKKFFALLVEQGEAASERPEWFKYWSAHPKGNSLKNAEKYASAYNLPLIPIVRDPFLEELVDQLHFILSIGNELELQCWAENWWMVKSNIIDAQMSFTKHLIDLYFAWRGNYHVTTLGDHYKNLLSCFLGIISAIGYTSDELVKAYYEKNKINHERQEDGY